MKKKPATRKKARKKKARKKAVSKKRKVNKSAAIRDYEAKHPGAKPAEIAAALASKGIDVTPAVVSSTLYIARKKKTKRKRGRGRQPSGGDVGDVMDSLLAAKKLAEQLGGIDRARKALDLLERLQ